MKKHYLLKGILTSIIATIIVVTVVYAATTIGTNIKTEGTLLVGSDASAIDFANAQAIFSKDDTTLTGVVNAALIGEVKAGGGIDAYALVGHGLTSGALNASGVTGYAYSNAIDTGSAAGIQGFTTSSHSGMNIGVVSMATNGSANYSFLGVGGDIYNDGNLVLDSTNSEALLVRKDGDGGDVLVVDTGSDSITVNDKMTISNNASADPFSGFINLTVGQDASVSTYPAIEIFSYNDDLLNYAPAEFFLAARGSASSLAALQNFDYLGTMQFIGYDGTNFSLNGGASISAQAADNWSAGSNPTQLNFYITPNGSSNLAQALTLGQDQSASFYGNITSSDTGDLGWSVVANGSTCEDSCTSACVFGLDQTGPALVDCNNAGAETCVCAGGS